LIAEATLVVQPCGNVQVRKTKRKNVHAFVRGFLLESFEIKDLQRIRYNPYKHTTFVRADTEQPVLKSDRVFLSAEGKCCGGL